MSSPATGSVFGEQARASQVRRFWTDRSWWLMSCGIAVAACMLMLGGMALQANRNEAWQRARQNAGNLALALDQNIGRNIAVLDLSLQGLKEALAEPGIDQVSPSVRQHALFDRSASAEDLGSMLVLDPAGNVVADSTSIVPHRLSFADRDYFRVHAETPDAGLFISRAYASRLANGDLRVAISRRLESAEGRFEGVIMATLRLNYFRRLFEKLDVGAKGTITLLRDDGRLLFRYPFQSEDIDTDVSAYSGNFRRFKAAQSGQYVAVSALDNVERLITFRHIDNLPLILSVSLSTEEILRSTRRETAVIGAVMVLLCLAAIACCVLFRREMLRRGEIERALAAAAEKLGVLASTDALTNLPNRRSFDVEFERAFRVAVRNGTPIAVLMIDADFFKRYNDAVGHVAGDDVLRAISGCIAARIRRPSDVTARYGGEEFVAVLPDTDARAGSCLAGSICRAVRELAIPHPDSPFGYVSVSIGVAATTPLIGDSPEQLLQLADQTLYAAKEAGRDRVRSTIEPNEPDIDLSRLARVATATRD